MWVIRWLSTSSLFFVTLVRFRFLRSLVTTEDGLVIWVPSGLVHGTEETEMGSLQMGSIFVGGSCWVGSGLGLAPSRPEIE